MSRAEIHVAVLAAGEGTRLPGEQPKVLVPIWGRPAVAWPVRAALELDPASVVVVGGRHLDAMRAALADLAPERVSFAVQQKPLGTGHALLAAREALAGARGDLLILYGDCPLVTADGLGALIAGHREAAAAATVLTARLADPAGYGRIVRDAEGGLARIVEDADASADERAIDEVNTGVWVVALEGLFDALGGLDADNAQGEIYLTDLVERLRASGGRVAAVEAGSPEDTLGFNDHTQLAEVRSILRRRIVARHLAAGVEVVAPETAVIDDTVTLEPGARILPFSVLEGDAHVATGCDVGPFARLRAGTRLQAGAKVGNFVETKKAELGAGAKASHLTYLGDCEVGAGANIGAGTITANYDGRDKHRTVIGERVFIGSGTVIVAPAEVEREARTGAGAIVTRGARIGAGETWVGVPARPLRSRDGDEASSSSPEERAEP